MPRSIKKFLSLLGWIALFLVIGAILIGTLVILFLANPGQM